MTEVMLCGAHDATNVDKAFSQIVNEFGFTPWFYSDGRILHINSANSSWTENSRATVRKVDICVFVILEKYGDITWNEELEEALDVGKPFIVLALEDSWQRFQILRRSISDPSSIKSEEDKKMLDVVRIMSENQFTVVSFSYTTFAEKLRYSLSQLLSIGLVHLTQYNQRKSLIDSIKYSKSLSKLQISKLMEISTDDYHENKKERKSAILRLSQESIHDNEFLLELCKSSEQGVQGLAFNTVNNFIEKPVDDDILRELALLASRSDDIGLARRLINNLNEFLPEKIDIAIENLEDLEEGVRRRAFEGIEANFDKVRSVWGEEHLRDVLNMCYSKSKTRASWIERLKALILTLNGAGA